MCPLYIKLTPTTQLPRNVVSAERGHFKNQDVVESP